MNIQHINCKSPGLQGTWQNHQSTATFVTTYQFANSVMFVF